jgi:hypothetical protein
VSVLTDLRAYWMRGKNLPACSAEKPEPGPQLGYLCTLPRGHKGKHVAHDIDGSLITRWSA